MLIGFVEGNVLPTKTIHLEADFSSNLFYVHKILDFVLEIILKLCYGA